MGEIISRFERAGLHLVGMKMVQASEDLLIGHYEGIGKLGTRRGQPIMDMVVSMMQTTPVLAMVWEGVEAVAFVRKIVGSTEPKSAAPGTIRGDFAHMSYGYLDANPGTDLFNLVHASADLEEALQEVPHWFNENELFASKALHTLYTR
jgi:nucleoside-diphosphate kinase